MTDLINSLKVLSLNIVILGVRAAIYEFEGDTIQFTTDIYYSLNIHVLPDIFQTPYSQSGSGD